MIRPYQSRALERIAEAIGAGRKRILLVAPTGAGKGFLIAELVRSFVALGERVCFVVHRQELVEDMVARLDCEGVPLGVMQADHERRDDARPAQVASIQTLARRSMPAPDLVVYDEAHHLPSQSGLSLLARWPDATWIGSTATPARLDGRGLGEHDGVRIFDSLIEAETPAGLIADGWLCPFDGFAFQPPAGLRQLHVRAGDFAQDELATTVDVPSVRGAIVEAWQQHAAGRSTVVFAVNVRHAQALAEQFRAAGVAAEAAHGEMSREERAEILWRVKTGATRVVCNCQLFGEGVDVSGWDCLVMARPTLSLTVWLQAVGRVLRPDGLGPEGRNRDKRAMILDHGGCIARLGMPDEAREWSLTASRGTPARREDAPPISICPKCFACWAKSVRGPACPGCGHEEPPEIPTERAAVAVRLEEMRRRAWGTEAERVAYARGLVEQVMRNGWNRRAFFARFRARFPGAPIPWAAVRPLLGTVREPRFSGWRRG